VFTQLVGNEAADSLVSRFSHELKPQWFRVLEATQQKENRSDRDITQQIRQAIMKDKSLSTYAHNVKIITQNGQVTLKGPVRSEDEKKTVEAKATEVAGENRVTSELDIKPKN